MLKLTFIFLASLCLPSFAADPDPFVDSCKKVAGPNPPIHLNAQPSANTLRVKAIFQQNCIACHGVGSKSAKKRFDNILDAKGLRDSGVVDPAKPDEAILFKRITLGPNQMPLGEDALPKADTDAIRQYIADGSPDFEGEKIPEQKQVTYEQEVACISYDVSRLDYYEAKYMRYATLSEIYNSGDNAKFKKAVWGLDKALNSLHFRSHLTKSTPVDYLGVIRRIDLRDYDLYDYDWDATLLVKYPYAVKFFYDRDFDGYEINIAQKTGSPRAFLRGDWLVREAFQPPLYYDFLGLPKTLQELEDQFFVKALYSGYYDASLVRGGIRLSGVANGNRVIDSRELLFWAQGQQIKTTFWITYDFDVKNAADKQTNLFAFPFGPRELNKNFYGKDATWYEANKVFKHDAGEVIFGLPNGLQGFYLADKNGKRQDEVPTGIATDRKNTAPQIGTVPFAIVNGVSCTGCHAGGMIPYTDQLRSHLLATAGFSPKQLDDLMYVVHAQKTHTDRVVGYNTVFQKAMKEIAKDPSVLEPNNEPIFWTTKYYLDHVTEEQAAHELKMPVDKFKDCMFRSADLARLLSFPVTRDVFEKHYGTILSQCNIGKQIVFKKVDNYVPPKCKVSVQNNTHYQLAFDMTYDGQKTNYQLAPNTSTKALETNSAGTLNYRGKAWTLVSCKDHSFKMQNGYVNLFQK